MKCMNGDDLQYGGEVLRQAQTYAGDCHTGRYRSPTRAAHGIALMKVP